MFNVLATAVLIVLFKTSFAFDQADYCRHVKYVKQHEPDLIVEEVLSAPKLVFTSEAETPDKAFYLISGDMGYKITMGCEHVYRTYIKEGNHKLELLYIGIKNDSRVFVYSGKFIEFEVKNNKIINLKSKDGITFTGGRDQSIEKIYNYMKTGADYMGEEDLP